MTRFAKVIVEASSKLKSLVSISDLAELMIMLREHHPIFFNSSQETQFLEEILLNPNDLDLARRFLVRRLFTSSQGIPVVLKELSIFREFFYCAFSLNLSQIKPSRKSLNVTLSLKNGSGSEIAQATSIAPLKSANFIDLVSFLFSLPKCKERFWTSLEYALVDLDHEKVIFSDVYNVKPFINLELLRYAGPLTAMKIFEPVSGSYSRLKKSDGVVQLELNLIGCKRNPIFVKWSKPSYNDFDLVDRVIFHEQCSVIPEYYFDSFTVEMSDGISEILCSDSLGTVFLNIFSD
ncbi:MAG: hypothetical protein NZO16_06680 [Deltaproteobacteria bacterium]|nr:hypothetical protein [Deltaproteobacteria bacterium]